MSSESGRVGLMSSWTLMKQGLPETTTWSQWLKELGATTRVGIDPNVISYKEAGPLVESLSTLPKREFVPIKENLVDLIWEDQPPRPRNNIFHLGDEYAGQSVSDKINALREKLNKIGSPGLVVSQLDEVAWLFNLRGSDIPYNPVFFAYAILTKEDCTLFCNPNSITADVREYLQRNKVVILEYSQVWKALESWGGLLTSERKAREEKKKAEEEKQDGAEAPKAPTPVVEEKGEKVAKTENVLIGNKASWAVAEALGKENVEVRPSIVEDLKARKNAVSGVGGGGLTID